MGGGGRAGEWSMAELLLLFGIDQLKLPRQEVDNRETNKLIGCVLTMFGLHTRARNSSVVCHQSYQSTKNMQNPGKTGVLMLTL